jgi:ABC-2 type transport system ATP-binding protein
MALNNILQVDALAFHFDTRPVFAGLSLTLEPGITWLRGPNGAGKTTLLKLFGGALLPAGGTIRMAGSPIACTATTAAAIRPSCRG